jgi:hypothetical protein
MPSFETRDRSVFVCLVAAKTEGDEMGQYVMALYQQLILHLRTPCYCGVILFTEFMLAGTLQDAAGARTGVAVLMFVACTAEGLWVYEAQRCGVQVRALFCSSGVRDKREGVFHHLLHAPGSAPWCPTASQLTAIGKKLKSIDYG